MCRVQSIHTNPIASACTPRCLCGLHHTWADKGSGSCKKLIVCLIYPHRFYTRTPWFLEVMDALGASLHIRFRICISSHDNLACNGSLESYGPYPLFQKVSKNPHIFAIHRSMPKILKAIFWPLKSFRGSNILWANTICNAFFGVEYKSFKRNY